MEKIILVLFLFLHFGRGVIYKLNDTMYHKMPPIFHFDNYDSCLSDLNGVYCTSKLVLVSDTPNDLLNMIHNYSEHEIKHYNHSQLLYGICVTQSCRSHFYDTNKKENLSMVLEKCFNDTILTKYELKARIMEPLICNTKNDKIEIQYWDYVFAGCFLGLITINLIGTVYHIFYVNKKEKKGPTNVVSLFLLSISRIKKAIEIKQTAISRKRNKFLMTFSLKRNWEKLVSPADDTNPTIQFVKLFNGVRTFAVAMVITAHSILPFVNLATNTHVVETMYDNVLYHTFINGTPFVQIFFIMSGFLLAYNIQKKSEKIKMTWRMIPMGMWLRWLRLTPSYAIMLAFTSTWLRFAGSGPLWYTAVGSEIEDCRRTGWQNLLYINNYFDDTQCMAQAWYLATEMQLYCLGLIVCLLFKTNYGRKIVLSLLFMVGVIIPGIITYMKDLDGVLVTSPTTSINYFITNPTFNYIYKRGHTNLTGYVIGLSIGFITYYLTQVKFDIQKYKKYLWIYQTILPIAILMLWMGIIFYRDAPRDTVLVRALYATLMKPIFTILMALLLLGSIFRCEENIRGFMEWRCWTATGRLSYCAYILHITLIRVYCGISDVTISFHFLKLAHFCVSTVVLTFLLATPFWLLIEAPMTEVLKLVFENSIRGTPKEPEKVETKTAKL